MNLIDLWIYDLLKQVIIVCAQYVPICVYSSQFTIHIKLIHMVSKYIIVEDASSEYAYCDVKQLRAQYGPTKKFLRRDS